MPRKCVVAGCNTKEGMGHNVHGFPTKNPAVCSKWVRAVHQNRKGQQVLLFFVESNTVDPRNSTNDPRSSVDDPRSISPVENVSSLLLLASTYFSRCNSYGNTARNKSQGLVLLQNIEILCMIYFA